MSQAFGISVLVDNCVFQRGWLAEHGLALLIVSPGGRKILFDSGQGLVLNRNAKLAGIRPRDIDALVLSHGHYDHGGGLSWFFGRGKTPRLHAHPGVFTKRWDQSGSHGPVQIGLPWDASQMKPHIDLFLTGETTELGDGVFFSGEITRRHPEEGVEKEFVVRVDNQFVQDSIEDDACIWIDIGRKRIVLLGCAHAGVINTLDHIAAVGGDRPIDLLIGGMHLIQADRNRLDWTAGELERRGVRNIVPLHCTGQRAAAYLAHRLPGRVLFGGAGGSYQVPG